MAPSFLPSSRPTTMKLLICSVLFLTANSFQNVGTTTRITKPSSSSSSSSSSSAVLPQKQHAMLLHPTQTKIARQTTSTATSTSLSMSALSSVASSIGSPAASLSVLALVILVHEAGHFLAARSLGITVKEFSVGVGPRLAGFRRYPNGKTADVEKKEEEEEDGGIDFSLRAIPLGGYVRFPENYNGTLAMQQEDEVRALRREARIEARLAKKEANKENIGIGKSSNGLLSMLTFGISEQQAQEEEEFLKQRMLKRQQEEQLKKSQWWKSILPLKPKKNQTPPASSIITSEDGTIKTPPIDYYTDPNLLQNRPWIERALVLSGGVIFNILLAFTLYFGEITVGNGLPRPMFEPGAVVSAMPRAGAPSEGLLEAGDLIVGVNGQKMLLSKAYDTPSAQGAITDLITSIRSTPSGEDIHLSVIKGGKTTTKTKTNNNNPVDITLTPKQSLDKLGKPTGPQSIGAMLGPNYVGTDVVRASSIPDAFVKSTTAVTQLTTDTTKSLLTFFGSMLAGKGAPAGQGMSGPIGVIKTGADIVSTNDISAVIMFAAAISVNLAVVNSLPLPALDGGQLVFVLAEAVAGRKIDQRVQENINAAALFMLLFFSFSTALGDVGSLVGL